MPEPNKRSYNFVSKEVTLQITQNRLSLIDMVKEGGTTVYMAAKELGIAYSTAKRIVAKHRPAKHARKQLSAVFKQTAEERHIMEVIRQETELLPQGTL
jgi:transposase-like protein